MQSSHFWRYLLAIEIIGSRAFAQLDQPDGDLCDEVGFEISAEKKLVRKLAHSYLSMGRNGRPVRSANDTVVVHFGLGLIQMDLDEKKKVLRMSMWSRYKWTDEYMRWNPSNYEGVLRVRMEAHQIWIPDIMLYNTADPNENMREVMATIDYNGTVTWVPHQIFKSSCSIDVTNFPFDKQSCHMWFGSWTFTSDEVDVELAFRKGIDLSTFQSDYKESSEWEIMDTRAEKLILPSLNETPNYAVLTFQLDMKRKLVFSSYILTLPCVFLACLTLVVFWLPPDRPDRTTLAMSIFASFLVLLLILVEAAPPTASSVPVLGVYYCFNMVIIMIAVFLSSLVVNLCRDGEERPPVPKWLKVLTINGLSRIFFMRNDLLSDEQYDAVVEQSHHYRVSVNRSRETTHSNGFKYDITPSNCFEPSTTSNGRHFDQKSRRDAWRQLDEDQSQASHILVDQLHHMWSSLTQIAQSLNSQQEAYVKDVARQWRDVALVLDRTFFLLYVILIIVSLVTLFPRPR